MGESVASRETVREAVDLRSLLGRLHATRERLPVPVALEIAAHLADVLTPSHPDIEPSSVLVGHAGTVEVQPRLDGPDANPADLPLESIDYLAPERLTLEPRTPASAVYSLGATLYEMLATDRLGAARGRSESHRAWLEERLTALRKTVSSPELETLLRDCLAFEPSRRPVASQLAVRARAIAGGGEAFAAWTAREGASFPPGNDDVSGDAPWGAWVDHSALDVPITRLPEPSPHDPTYYLPDPTRPRPVEVSDFTDPRLDDEDSVSEHTAPSDERVRSPLADEVTAIRPRSRRGGRLVVAGIGVAALAAVLYALQPRMDAAAGATPVLDAPPTVVHDTPVPVGVPVVVFESAAEGTSRVAVHCTDASAHGATRATVPAAAAATCTVTAILADRDRISAVVTGAGEGRYRCFAEGSADCRLE